ncbi:MAG: patatin-like phospholipase family protein [Gammaproteobacteria bacterium]|nr:patatin-like phospholipase family protein [Gammaproteobacteria bacterium]
MPVMSSLSLYAGPKALKKIQAEGLSSKQFKVMAGASGGPKWFVLYGLDRYLFGEFFADREDTLATLGSSAGAWRLSCLGTSDPVGAIDRLAKLYSTEHYSAKPTPKEITDKARDMLHKVLGPDGGRELVENKIIKQHIITDRCRGLLNVNSKIFLGTALALAAASNLINRRLLSLYFERVVFNNHEHPCELAGLKDIRTVDAKLSEENVYDVLIASGSIPLVLEGERNIAGASAGLYLDGGITDYHLDVPFHGSDGLVLYPHFYPRVIPGWFDKHLLWRKVDKRYYDNVLLVVPSRGFVDSLPYKKIPDRKDFEKLEYSQRVGYWQTVLKESQRLADDFAAMVDSGRGLENIKLFDPGQS